MSGTALIIWSVIAIFEVVVTWKVFVKAGQPGWASIVPVYSFYVLLDIAGKPGWWLVLMFLPGVNIIIGILVSIGVADAFGRGIGFKIGMVLLPFIFFPILAFSNADSIG